MAETFYAELTSKPGKCNIFIETKTGPDGKTSYIMHRTLSISILLVSSLALPRHSNDHA
jgi:hypothetical protein